MKLNMEAEAEKILLDNYEKYYRLAYSYVNHEQDALDVVQESAYKVMKDIGKVREPEYLATWICRVVINTAVDFLRKRKKESVGLEEVEIAHEDVYREDDPMELLKTLEERDRTIVVLKVIEEFRLEEIAAVLEMNVNTVKARLYRALKKLRMELDPDLA